MSVDEWEWDDDMELVGSVLLRHIQTMTLQTGGRAGRVALTRDLAALVKQARGERDPAVAELERGRRAGWRRVAELERIVDVGNITHASAVGEGETVPFHALLDECDRVDPVGRERWPAR